MALSDEDAHWIELAKKHMDGKAKPPGSLGLLETWAIKLAALQRTLHPTIASAHAIIFAGDHGITHSNPSVSAYPRHVTTSVFQAIASGVAASSVLAAAHGATLELVNVGVDAPTDALDLNDTTGIHPKKGRTSKESNDADQEEGQAGGNMLRVHHHRDAPRGSSDMSCGPAMTASEAQAAMQQGRDAVVRALKHFHTPSFIDDATASSSSSSSSCSSSSLVLCIGELGIGNTTAAAAMTAALTGSRAEDACGRGTGVDDAGYAHKIKAIESALHVNAELIAQGGVDGVLQAVGGLEIAAMVGAYVEASKNNLPVLVDGFISSVAAICALKMDPLLHRCLFFSHRSLEQGYAAVLAEAQKSIQTDGCGGASHTKVFGNTVRAERNNDSRIADVLPALWMVPPLDMGLRLGEGTGALLALPLLRSAAAIMCDMASLEDILQN